MWRGENCRHQGWQVVNLFNLYAPSLDWESLSSTGKNAPAFISVVKRSYLYEFTKKFIGYTDSPHNYKNQGEVTCA